MIPTEISDLLAELKPGDSVSTIESSKMVVFAPSGQFELDAQACEKILESPKTVGDFIDVLGGKDISVELHGLILNDDVVEALERSCDAVDEI